MSNVEDSIDSLKQFQRISDQISDLTKSIIPSDAIFSSIKTMLDKSLVGYQDALRASINVALNPAIKSISETVKGISEDLAKNVAGSLSSIVKLQSESTAMAFEPIYKSISEYAKLTSSLCPSASTYMESLTSQWNDVIKGIPNSLLDYPDELSLDDDITDKVSEIIEQAVPNESEEKSEFLCKIKGKISIGELIDIIGLLITILLAVYNQLSTNAEQKAIKEQNQAIIEEFQETQKILKENEQCKEKILDAIQQLTDTAQELGSISSPVNLNDQ